jgi:hypothetical protein
MVQEFLFKLIRCNFNLILNYYTPITHDSLYPIIKRKFTVKSVCMKGHVITEQHYYCKMKTETH